MQIHSTAIISPKASIGDNVVIGPYCVIGDKVTIGNNCRLHSHVVVDGNTVIGDDTEVFPFASIGHRPQDLKFRGEDSQLLIGKKNIIREYVTLQPGTSGGGMKTTVGDGNLFMANSHLGHDSIVGNNNVIANSVAIAGHVTIGNRVTIGGICGIHQFVRISDFAMIGAGSMVTLDIAPGCIAQGDRAELIGVNTIGLKRGGFEDPQIQQIRTLYKSVFLRKGSLKEKIQQTKEQIQANSALATAFLDFVSTSERGLAPARGKKGAGSESGEV